MTMPFIILLRAVLVLALLGTGTVPQGMMRAATGDGLRMVICTDGGLREVLIAADGTITPAGSQPDSDPDHGGMPCLVISQTMPDHAPALCPAPLPLPRDAALTHHHDLHLPPATAPPCAQPRAPPLSL